MPKRRQIDEYDVEHPRTRLRVIAVSKEEDKAGNEIGIDQRTQGSIRVVTAVKATWALTGFRARLPQRDRDDESATPFVVRRRFCSPARPKYAHRDGPLVRGPHATAASSYAGQERRK